MKTLIVFASRHGSSEKAANMLKVKINGNVKTHDIKKRNLPNLNDYDAIIIGGSIHAGEIQIKIKKYCQNNSKILSKKHLGLYLCSMDKEKAQLQFENAYNENLRKNALVTSLFGGEFVFEKMNWFERSVVKKVAGVSKSVSAIDEAAIDRFAEKFNLLPK